MSFRTEELINGLFFFNFCSLIFYFCSQIGEVILITRKKEMVQKPGGFLACTSPLAEASGI